MTAPESVLICASSLTAASASGRASCTPNVPAEGDPPWRLLEERRLDPKQPSHGGYRRTSDFRVSPTNPDVSCKDAQFSLMEMPTKIVAP